MSEEEKEAIKIVEDIAFIRGIRQDVDGELEDLGAIEDVLRLIDKLQKENEELKERNKGLTTAIEEWVNGERINDIKHISKDKIRNKIKEYEENIEIFKNLHKADGIGITECKILGLKELLEEE